jgi:hypothetical protein
MTKSFGQTIVCQHCGKATVCEAPFNQWVRLHPLLKSNPDEAAIVITDIDMVIHKFKTVVNKIGTRNVRLMMYVEVKTNGALVESTQEETLSIFSQNVTTAPRWKFQKANGQFECGHFQNARRVKVTYGGTEAQLFDYGVHYLFLSGSTPKDSRTIQWDKLTITEEQLVKILRFDVRPDDPEKPMEIRRRKKPRTLAPTLFDPPLPGLG